MTNGELLKNNFPACFDKTAEIFSALLANDNETGCIEYALNKAEEYAEEYANSSDVYSQEGDMLEKSVSFFSYIEKITNETDAAYKRRMQVLFLRGNDSVWGSIWNIKHVFEDYFSNGKIFVAENVNDTSKDNLMKDYDFTDDTGAWSFGGDAEKTVVARFSNSSGALIPPGDTNTLSQTVINLSEGKTYFIHFMLKGNVECSVKCGSVYWDAENRSWNSTEKKMEFSSLGKWGNMSLWVNSLPGEEIEFKVYGGEEESWCDYFRMFEKQQWPSFSVIVQFEGLAKGSELAIAPNINADPDDDPIPGINYETNARYLGRSSDNLHNGQTAFLTGVQAGYAKDIYEDLLNYMRAVGTKAYMEIVNRDYIGESDSENTRHIQG